MNDLVYEFIKNTFRCLWGSFSQRKERVRRGRTTLNSWLLLVIHMCWSVGSDGYWIRFTCLRFKWNRVYDEIDKVKRIGELLNCLTLKHVYERYMLIMYILDELK
jgi:hypothetical protein